MAPRSASTATQSRVTVEPSDDPRAAEIVRDGAISVAAFARHVGLSRTSIWGLMDAGEIAWVKASARKRLIPRSELVRWLSSNLRVGPVNPE